MTSIGHLVSKFQVKEGDETLNKAKEKQSSSKLSDSQCSDGASSETPGGDKARSKPAPPGPKPSRLPSGVALRKQNTVDTAGQQQRPGTAPRQPSVSFTTEDLDLFQRRPKYAEPPPLAEKPDARRSRKDSNQGRDSSSDKRRSRSVGAPAFGGLRPIASENKPAVPNKPAIAEKPRDSRKKPSGLPRPFQAQKFTDTSDEPTAGKPHYGNRNKSYRTAVRSSQGSRPESGSRARSGSLSKSKKPSESTKSPTHSKSPAISISTDAQTDSHSQQSPGSSYKVSSRIAVVNATARPFSASTVTRTTEDNTENSTPSVSSLPRADEQRIHKEIGSAPKDPNEKTLPGQRSEHTYDRDSKRKDKTLVSGSFIPVTKNFSPKVPPKVSPKPSISSGRSPTGSPKTLRSVLQLPLSVGSSKEDAKQNILSVLALRSDTPTSGSHIPAKGPVCEGRTAEHGSGAKKLENIDRRNFDNEEQSSLMVEKVTTTETVDCQKGILTEQTRVSVTIGDVTTTESSDFNEPRTAVLTTSVLSSVSDISSHKKESDNVLAAGLRQNKSQTATQGKESKAEIVESLGIKSPALMSAASKPSIPPPPPPSSKQLESNTDDLVSVATRKVSDTGKNGIDRIPVESSAPVPLKPDITRLTKLGLDSKCQDVPLCKLVSGKSSSSSSQSSIDVEAPSPLFSKPLPLKVFSAEQKGPPSDSNDADDEADLSRTVKVKLKVYIKSFSLEQKDLKTTSLDCINRTRPSSAFSAESDSSAGETSKSKTKNGVFQKLRKVSPSPQEEISDERRQVGGTTFYPEEAVAGTTKEGELLRTVGRTTFYSSDSKTNGESTNSQDEATKGGPIPAGRRREVSMRHSTAGRKLSNKSFRSITFVENDIYDIEHGLQPYENVFYGPMGENRGENVEDGKNALNNSSGQTVDGERERSSSRDMDALGSRDPAHPMGTHSESERGFTEEAPSTDEDRGCHIYDNDIPFPSRNIYANVGFMSYNGTWRRKTIKHRQTTKKNNNENEGEESNSDDSFESISETEDASVEGEAPPPEQTVSKVVKLKRIATELLTTERAFVKRLHLIDQVFHFNIVLKNRENHMFPDDVIPQMFSNIKSIYQFHNDFLLPQLEKRMEDWESTPKIGDLMRKFAPFLKLYSEYVKNFDHAVNIINSWQQRSHMFANILAELQKRPDCAMLTLQHHMLEPIQRVPRYEMLLKDYLKNLPEEDPDKPDTEKALELVTTAAAHANETMWKIEKFRKLLELNEMFGGVVDLIDPSRELVKEGKIFKISARNGVLYDRYLFLFTDMLMLCQTHRMNLTRSYHINNVLKLNGMQVLEGDNLETPFTFYVKTKSKTIELHSSTREEMMDWYVTIETMIADYTKRQMSRLAGLKTTETDDKLGFCAPTWVKDQNTSMCMMCGTSFSMLKRRHHCRCCGIVVCARCSSHKAPLAYQNNKPDRVCDNCYKTLSGRKDTNSQNSQESPRVKGVLQVRGSDPSVVSGVMLLSSDKKIWERRWFALHENFVLYTFKAPQDVHAITSMPLPGYTVSEATKNDHLDKERVIKIYHGGTKKVYFFHVDNNANYTKWLTGLQYAVKVELPPDYEPAKKDSKD